MKLTKEQALEFIAKLEKAKPIAVERYPDIRCIFLSCTGAGLFWGVPSANAEFYEGGIYRNKSARWVWDKAQSSADIAAVFDNSIAAVKRMAGLK